MLKNLKLLSLLTSVLFINADAYAAVIAGSCSCLSCSSASHHDHDHDHLGLQLPSTGGFESYVTQGNSWGAGATVTYSYATSTYAYDETIFGGDDGSVYALWDTVNAPGFASLTEAQIRSQIDAAFDAWQSVIDITFVEVADNNFDLNAAGATGEIRIGAHYLGPDGGTLAHGYYPPPNGITYAGDIHFGTQESWVIGFAGSGFDLFQVAAHEIGHAIGLRHSDDINALMYETYSEAFRGPQADDIAGGMAIYGALEAGVTPEPSVALLFLLGSIVLRVFKKEKFLL